MSFINRIGLGIIIWSIHPHMPEWVSAIAFLVGLLSFVATEKENK